MLTHRPSDRTNIVLSRERGAILAILVLGGFVSCGTLVALPQESSSEPSRLSVELEEPAFVALRVRDVAAAATWYANVFGLEPVKNVQSQGGAIEIRILGDGVLTVELIEQHGTDEAPDRHLGLFKAGFYVEDVSQTLDRLRGLRVVPPGEDVTVFVDAPLRVRSFLIRDPEGNRLQFFERCGASC